MQDFEKHSAEESKKYKFKIGLIFWQNQTLLKQCLELSHNKKWQILKLWNKKIKPKNQFLRTNFKKNVSHKTNFRDNFLICNHSKKWQQRGLTFEDLAFCSTWKTLRANNARHFAQCNNKYLCFGKVCNVQKCEI